MHVAIEERREVLGVSAGVGGEHLAAMPESVRRRSRFREVAVMPKASAKPPAQGALTGAAGGQERSIDIESSSFFSKRAACP